MLEDFIESNKLKARIMPFHRSSNLIKCRFFLADESPVLVVASAFARLDEQKIRKELECKMLEDPLEKEALEMTGYPLDFLPPISIYGIRVLIDKKLFGNGNLYCKVSETDCLEITAEEIREQNDEAVVGDYSR